MILLKLAITIEQERSKYTIFPPREMTFAFMSCPLNDVKVVILGQDPYHGVDQACGLSFSVGAGVKIPPSLRNIYKELKNDGFNHPNHGLLY